MIAAGLWFAAGPTGRAATGTIQDVQHVVILMMENRSTDHYLGCMGGIRGYNDRHALQFNNGNSDFYQPSGANYVLPFPLTNQCMNDVDHGQPSGLADWDDGKWDQWVPAKGPPTMAYYTPDYLPLHSALVSAYTTCDDYFCSLIGPTYPNRLYLFTGMIDPSGTGGGPATANNIPPGGFTWTTYPECLQAAGVSWKVYRPQGDWFGDVLPWFAQFMNATPGNPLYDRGVAEVPDVATALRADVSNGTLPQVSWIIPTLLQSGHPPYSPVDGEVFIQSIYNALTSNPAVFDSTVLLVTYDENGGFFDHVPSPIAPPGTPGEYVHGQPLGLGVRVPMLVMSPWSRGGKVCSQVFDHTSVIRFLETWTGVAETNISAWRRQVCGDLTSAFDFAHPDFSIPRLPSATGYETDPYTPIPPNVQFLPVQQTNTLVSMPLPYQAEVSAQTSCFKQALSLTLTNSGAASMHFAIYANPAQSSGPQQCDVNPGQALILPFAVSTANHGAYDLTVSGPNGFQRRFAGNLNSDCGQVEAVANIDTNAGTVTVYMENLSGSAAEFLLTDGYGLGGPWTNYVPAGVTISNVINAVAQNNGWYDLTVLASGDASFVRHFTGHIETGAPSLTEPVLSPMVVPVTPVFPVLPTAPSGPVTVISSPGVAGILAGLPMSPSTSALPCYCTSFGTNMVLIYPAWASNYAVMGSSTLQPGSWTPVNLTTTNSGNYVVATVPLGNIAMFFRLKQYALKGN